MKKITLVVTLMFMLLLSSPFLKAQENKDTSASRTKMVTISGGYAMIDVTALNQFIAPSTPGSFDQNFITMGIQSTREYKGFICGFTLQGGSTMKKKIQNYDGNLGQTMEYNASFGNVLLHGGYALINTNRVKFYPMLGAGLGGVSAKFNRDGNTSTLQFSNNPTSSGSVTKPMAMFDGSLTIDFLMPVKRYSSGSKSVGRVASLRVGYTQGVGVGNWRFSGGRILENPSYNTGIIYAKLQIGMFTKSSGAREGRYYR